MRRNMTSCIPHSEILTPCGASDAVGAGPLTLEQGAQRGRRLAVWRGRTVSSVAGNPPQPAHPDQGHSTIVLTADTYTSVLPETARTAAELTAALLFPVRHAPARRGKPAARRFRKQPLPAWARRR
jgi:hypothetical protein